MALNDYNSNAGWQTATESAIKQTAIFDAKETFDGAQKLSDRIIDLVNRIVGPVPPSPTLAQTKIERSGGMLDELRSSSESASQAIRRGHEFLDRLDAAF